MQVARRDGYRECMPDFACPKETVLPSDDPVVSVVIPSRDCMAWLPAAVSSVGDRTDIEIIVVDDGSSDGSDAWLAAAARDDHRIRALSGGGRGPSAARNLAIEAAQAPLVAFLDADDTWLPGKLDAQLEFHARYPRAGFSFTDYRHVGTCGEDLGSCFAYWPHFRSRHARQTSPFLLGNDALAQIYAENVIGTSTVVARTSVLRHVGGFGTTWPSAEDWALWLSMAGVAEVGCIPQVLTNYLVRRPGSISRRLRVRVLAMSAIAARFRECARQQDARSLRICEARILGARAALAASEGRHARAFLLQSAACAHNPTWRELREALSGLIRG